LALAASVLPLQASATFVDGGTYVQDTSTGLDWLKLNYLNGYSYQNVAGGALGYTTSGWRFARKADLLNLFTTNVGALNGRYGNGGSEFPLNGESTAYTFSAESLVILLGMNVAINDARATYNVTGNRHQISIQGFYDDENAANQNLGIAEASALFSDVYPSGPVPVGRWVLAPDFMPPNQFGPWLSSYLIRDSLNLIPEPGTLALLALGLAGLGHSRRKSVSRRCAA